MSAIHFAISARDGAARAGRLELAHGVVHTPAFMPVGTAATVKGMLPEAVAASGAEILLGNVYHLMLRPGAERIAELGGRTQHRHQVDKRIARVIERNHPNPVRNRS